MAIINKIDNFATITYDGIPINSNTVETLLLVAPTILKAVDKLTANVGDTLTYTITITNLALTTLTNLPFSDTVPSGSNYVDGSFKVNGSTVTPQINNNILTYTIPSVPISGVTTIEFEVTIVGGES